MTIDTADHVLNGTSGYQPRYVAYACAHGRRPEAMLAHDEKGERV